jgi:hypothetical protein
MAQQPIYISDAELAGDLKNLYSDIRNELFPISTPLLSAIQKRGPEGANKVNWGGNNVYFDIVVGPPVNWSFSTTGQLPYSSEAQEVQGNVGIARFYVTRAFDNLAMVGTASKEAAFIGLREKITFEFSGAMELGMQEALHGNGTGVKAILSSSASTTTFVATSPYGIAGAGQGGLWLYKGMYIAVYDTTGVTLRGVAQVLTVANTADNVTVTLATAIAGMVATDIIVQANQSGSALNAYANGMTNICNRGSAYNSLHGQTAATYGRWDSLKFVAGTDTDTLFPQEMDIWNLAAILGARSGKRALSNPKEFLIVTTYGICQQLIASVIGQRTQPRTTEKLHLPGGYEVDEILGIPMVADEYCPVGTLYLLHRPSLGWVDAADWSPVQYENSGAVRFINGQDGFETSYKQYYNVMTSRRNALAIITGYQDSRRYTPVV